MTFDNPIMPCPQCGPMDPDCAELTIAPFLEASRRYFDMTSQAAAKRRGGGDEKTHSAGTGAKRRKRCPPDYRSLLSSVLLASTLGLSGVSSSYATVHSAPRSTAPGAHHPRLAAGETPPQEP